MCDITYCQNLEGLNKFQTEKINKHIEAFMCFRGITNKEKAIICFLNENGWLMREDYCKDICPYNCNIWERYIKFGKLKPKPVKEISDWDNLDARR